MRFIRSVAAVVLLVAIGARSAIASDWYVDLHASGGGDGSAAHPFQKIGDGVRKAVDGDRVLVAAGSYAERLTISASISILGDRNAVTTVDGDYSGTIFTISSGKSVWLQDLTLTEGLAGDGKKLNYGGGINNEGTLIGVRLHFFKCSSVSATTNAGGGAIDNSGVVLLWSCWIEKCGAGTGYDVLHGTTGGAACGGAIRNVGLLKLFSCTLSANSAATDVNWVGAGAAGGAIYTEGAVRLVNTTLSGNSVSSRYATGGGIFVGEGGSLYVDHSTIESNHAQKRFPYASDLGIAAGGGICGFAQVRESIIAGNAVYDDNYGGSSYGPDFYGTCDSLGYLLIENPSDTTIIGDLTGVQTLVNPELLTLADNGGPVLTCALDAASPCIDAGNADPLASPPYDARNFPRALWDPATGASDLGAYESGATISFLLTATPDVPLPAGATVTLATGGGVYTHPNLVTVVHVNGAPAFLPLFFNLFDQATVIVKEAVVPAGLSGTTAGLKSFSLDANGKLEISNEAVLVFQ